VRRADRLFQVIQLLRRKRVATAATLAEELEVSERTIYRDIRDLVLSGVPIEGEAGVGYMLRKGFDLPPLMFTEQEVEALVLGVRVVKSWGDAQLGRAASDALARVEAALPERLRTRLENTPLFAPGFRVSQTIMGTLSTFRAAIDERRKVWIAYTDPKESSTERAIRPLGLFFWGATWSVTGWCELRDDFRTFRLDRISTAKVLDDRFEPDSAKSLDAFFDMMRNDHGVEMGTD
jgi:predicted DNA-binding transcriptional regulator YafY